jgi:MoxR-like ATPase
MTQEFTVDQFRETMAAIEAEIARVVVDQTDTVRHLLIALVAGGHVLLEGMPGLGKATMVRTLAQVLDLGFAHLSFTPDLVPADVVGRHVLEEDQAGRRRVRFQPGPIFANVILGDDIHRAAPRTQSALLEAMQERTITAVQETHPLPQPFFVTATRHPVPAEDTHPLSAAQVDRFLFKLDVPFPDAAGLGDILDRTTGPAAPQARAVAGGPALLRMADLSRGVSIAEDVRDYAVRLLLATHPDHPFAPEAVRRDVRRGASPRGAQAIIRGARVAALLDGRDAVTVDDLRALATPSLRHRILLNAGAESRGLTADDVVQALLEAVPEQDTD